MSDKLTKMVLMLSSPNDGEVVAAARAIDRHLSSLGKDWHWFAAQFSASAPGHPFAKAWPSWPTPSSPFNAGRWSDNFTDADKPSEPSWRPKEDNSSYVNDADRAAVYLIIQFITKMEENERTFVINLHSRVKRYGGSTFISPKQSQWLRDLVEKYV